MVETVNSPISLVSPATYTLFETAPAVAGFGSFFWEAYLVVIRSHRIVLVSLRSLPLFLPPCLFHRVGLEYAMNVRMTLPTASVLVALPPASPADFDVANLVDMNSFWSSYSFS